MKIGIVCYPSVGGSGILATELGHALARRGHEVHFITYDVPFRLNVEKQNIHFHEVEINQYDLFKYPDYALTLAVKMANISKQVGLDILHVHYAIPHATSAYLAKQILGGNGPVVITTLHGTDITLVGSDPNFTDVVKFSIEQSDGVTVVSEALKRQTEEMFDIKKEIRVIYNFFNPDPQYLGKKPLRKEFVGEGEKLLLHCSNFRPVKCPLDVLKIFEKIREKVKCKLLLLGTGAGLESIRHRVAEQHLQKEVFFVGENRIIDPFVASSDLFLLPSAQESFGLAALEAMAYGVPPIASHVGGLPELIVHGESGFLAPVGDIESMANYGVALLQNEGLYAQVSQSAQQRAKEHFSSAQIIPQYEAYYASKSFSSK